MSKGKVKDFLLATKDEAVSRIMESELVPEMIETFGEVIVSEGVAALIGDVIGASLPVINGIRLSYKQNRFERHVNYALQIMSDRIGVLEANFNSLNSEVQESFKGKYLEWLMDNLYEEKQTEKVPCHINGYINLMSNEANDNLLLMFFETINELTELDIDVLRLHSSASQGTIYELCERYKLSSGQVMVVKEKLARLGLLESKNDELRDNNIDQVVEYLTKVAKDNKKKNPTGVSFPNTRIKKPNRYESYHITELGRGFLKVISN
ncbi:MAG: hypothetical protein IJW04_08035 [Ruminococcus sp.]|nr:hypothetical protein [Ruminococcus sp.]